MIKIKNKKIVIEGNDDKVFEEFLALYNALLRDRAIDQVALKDTMDSIDLAVALDVLGPEEVLEHFSKDVVNELRKTFSEKGYYEPIK